MSNPYFRFKQFTIYHDRCAMKVTTDGCLFGAWVAKEVGSQLPAGEKGHLLDIGTGTGLLSLMVAQKNNATIDAIEIDVTAAEQAKENIAGSPWKENISIFHEDVLQRQTQKQYSAIFSNPPFYQNELKSATEQKNVAHHEKGLKLQDLILYIRDHLFEDGTFFLLLPAKRETELESLLQQNRLYLQQKVHVQQTLKHQPFRLMIQGRRKKVKEVKESMLAIKGNGDVYTPEFVALLKDYYLYL